jgi:hypothetical protein
MNETCRKCGAEKQPWHPGPGVFECDELLICYACDLGKCELRRSAVQNSPLVHHLLRARQLPFVHQVLGVETLIRSTNPATGRVIPDCFALFDEMGVAKTKQVIDAVCVMFEMKTIDRVIVVAPAPVRDVWYDSDLGELKKHLWKRTHHKVTRYHAQSRAWLFETDGWADDVRYADWVITNYEFLRSGERLEKLLPFCTKKTILVLDESSAVKNVKAEQTRACLKLRAKCGRVVLLNGTPIANSPLDMYAQGQLMHPKILECKTYFHFRSRYAIQGGWNQRQVVGWQFLDDLQRRFKPYVLRRLKSECLDLPEKLDPVTLTVPLTPRTWNLYREMRDEMVAWLSEQTVSVASQAGVKAMRLAQVCAGFIGGVEWSEPADFDLEPENLDQTRPDFVRKLRVDPVEQFVPVPKSPLQPPEQHTLDCASLFGRFVCDCQGRRTGAKNGVLPVQEVGREKLDALIDWVRDRLVEDPNLKLLVWCRFRPEVERTLKALAVAFPQMALGAIWGGQTEDKWKIIDGQRKLVKEGERGKALRLLDPRTMPKGPAGVVGTTATGSMGLTLVGAHTVIYLTNDFSLKLRLQSEDRTHRPGQTSPVSYTDVVTVGPKGQKTVDHVVIKALRDKSDVANWTTRAWIAALMEE